MKTRSIDDIRNYWVLKVLPVLNALGGEKGSRSGGADTLLDKWAEQDDIALLESIEAQEVTEVDEPIDFSAEGCSNSRTREENQSRWNLLLKGLCAMRPGQRFNPSKMARTMIEDIRSSPERYVQWAVPKTLGATKRARTGLNHYIDIHAYFKQHFA